MSDIFDEVNEEVRREQFKKLWERYGALILGVALAIVIGVGGWRGYQWWETKRAGEIGSAFEAAIALGDQNKHAEAQAAFEKIAAEAPRGYRGLARLRAANELAASDAPGAVKVFEAIAADTSMGQIERDLAALRAGGLLVDGAAYDEVARRLEPLAAPGRTYRHSARELLALAAMRAGNTAGARQWLDAIVNDAESPPSLRGRAEALQNLLPPAARS
ncbi:MAG: tetratricopeptide repeat protein [Xanthobacteraceae bacterium]|nr:MAG: tetratricopeptide repeat protein [Xanthobacteraceae bacterium]